jgi:hypothetical protein
MMVETTHLGHGNHRSEGWRLHRAWIGAVHCQGEMDPPAVIIGQVTGQDAPEMALTEHDDVVQALLSDTDDETLHRRILPREIRSRNNLSHLQGMDSLAECRAI